MHPVKIGRCCGLVLLALLLVACESMSQTGAQTSSQQGMNGGSVSARISKANGSATEEIDVEGYLGEALDADVTLSVGSGTFKIELLGEDGEATLTVEARDGQAVSGQGQMAVDDFGEASYRVTAEEAEDVEYTIEYAYR
jgi:hypothetical protein